MLRRLLVTLLLVAIGLPSLAMADQIAQVNEALGQGNAYILTDKFSVNGTETFTVTNLPVYFSFNSNLGTGVPQNVDAILNVSATSTTVGSSSPDGSQDSQGGFVGSFSITSGVYGNLLSGTFASAGYAQGADGGNGLTFTDTDTTKKPNEVVFTSQYLNFNYYVETEVMSFALSNLSSPLALDLNNFLVSNTGSGVDTFSATPLPPPTPAEPGTVLLSGAALLGIGLVLRKRRLQLFL